MEYNCKNCPYCKFGRVVTGVIKHKEYFCKYPDLKYLISCIKKKRAKGKFAYVGRGGLYSSVPEKDVCPSWCPRKMKGE